MDGLTDHEKMLYRRTIPGTIGDICNAASMSQTADGRQELKNKGYLRDDRHWVIFDALPEVIYLKAREAFLADPAHAERFGQVIPAATPAEDARIDLAPGFIDHEVLIDGDRSLVKKDAPSGFVIPIYSGLGTMVGLDILQENGSRIESYWPPDGLYLPSGSSNPFVKLLDMKTGGWTPIATYIVGNWRSMIQATALRPDSKFVGRTSGSSVYNDIAEMASLRPVLIGDRQDPAGAMGPTTETESIASDLFDVGYPQPPVISWAAMFGDRSSVDRARRVMGREVGPG